MILLISTGCKNGEDDPKKFMKHKHYKLTAKQTGYNSKPNGDFHAFGVQLDLTTDYDTLPPLHFMTCSWANDLGHTSDTSFHIGYHSCDANFPSFERITSKDTLRFLSVVITTIDKEFEYTKLRLGISIIDTIKVPWRGLVFGDLFLTISEQDSIMSRYERFTNDPNNIVWSDSIELTKMKQSIKHSGSVELICGNQSTHEHCR